MYRRCIYCHRDLGDNETIEEFPIGRRLAFDGAKGRLWVICTGCRRWNLTPLEERWEAIEECERQFRQVSTRFSTDNIGLARLPEGVDLVRVGRPLRPEFAAWRYSREFWRRRVVSAAGSIISGAGAVAVAGGLLAVGAGLVVPYLGPLFRFLSSERRAASLRDKEGETLYLTGADLERVELV